MTTTGGWKEGYFFALYKVDEFFVLAISQDEQSFTECQFLQLIAQEFMTVLDQITGGLYTSIKPEHHG